MRFCKIPIYKLGHCSHRPQSSKSQRVSKLEAQQKKMSWRFYPKTYNAESCFQKSTSKSSKRCEQTDNNLAVHRHQRRSSLCKMPPQTQLNSFPTMQQCCCTSSYEDVLQVQNLHKGPSMRLRRMAASKLCKLLYKHYRYSSAVLYVCLIIMGLMSGKFLCVWGIWGTPWTRETKILRSRSGILRVDCYISSLNNDCINLRTFAQNYLWKCLRISTLLLNNS